MVLSGVKNTDFANGFLRLALEWSATQNITGNTSTVTAKLYLQGLNSNSTINASASNAGYITIDGAKSSFNATSAITGTQKKLLFTATKTVTHGTDGTKTLVLDAGFNVNITFSGVKYDWQYAGGSFELNKINRTSKVTLSANEFNIGTAITVNTNRSSTAYTHTIRYKFGNATANIATGVTTSTVFNVPKSFANQNPNGISGTGTIYCDTYNGSTLIGTTTANFIAWTPDTAEFRPTITGVTITDLDTAITTKFGGYVQNRTQLNVKFNGAGVYGSIIKSQRVTVGSETLTGNNVITNPLPQSGAVNVVTTVTDSRGRTTSVTTPITVLSYSEPAITALTAKRVNADGTDNTQGTSIQVTFVASIASVGAKNDKTYTVRYKKVNDANYQEKAVTGDYDASLTTKIDSLTADNAYNIVIVASDYFSETTRQTRVATAFTLLDLRSGGKGLGIGKVSEKDALEVALPMDVTGNTTIYAPSSTDADSGLLRLRRADGTLIAFIATSDGGTGLNIHTYAKATNAWAGMIKVNEDGSIYTSGGIVNEARKAPTLLNNWANYGDGFTPASYWKDANGVVHITGLIRNGTVAKDTVLFNLPAGYRPFGAEIMTVQNGDNTFRRISILVNGNVILGSSTFTTGWLSLANISFKAEN